MEDEHRSVVAQGHVMFNHLVDQHRRMLASAWKERMTRQMENEGFLARYGKEMPSVLLRRQRKGEC